MENADSIVQEVKEVQGAVESILRDTLGDYKEREKAREIREKRQYNIILSLIGGMVISFIVTALLLFFQAQNYDIRFKEFLSQYDFTSEVTVEGQDAPAFYQKGEGNTVNNGTGQSNPTDAPQG